MSILYLFGIDLIKWISLSFNVYSLWEKIKIRYKSWRKTNGRHMLSYHEDGFAHDTIRYRFREIMHSLNNHYEDACKELKIPEFKRPFSYSVMLKTDFHRPKNLLNSIEENNRIILNEFYSKCESNFDTIKKFGDVFEELPFIDVEHLFYFYLLDIFYGFDICIQEKMSDNIKCEILDPYKLKKKEAIIKDLEKGLSKEDNKNKSPKDEKKEESSILKCLDLINKFDKSTESEPIKRIKYDDVKEILTKITLISLDSNTNDLSQLSDRRCQNISKERIFPYEIEKFSDLIWSIKEETEINYLVDNSGVEFFADLTFAYVLLQMQSINNVILHINKLPVFVSDVIESDYEHMMGLVEKIVNNIDNKNKEISETKQNADDNNTQPGYGKALKKIQDLVKEEKIKIVSNFIWNMPTPYKELRKKDDRDVFSKPNSILIIKGDLNYRRLVEDKNWKYNKKIENFTQYIECPTLVVRSIKSNLVLDFKESEYNKLQKTDKYWKENGEYGVIRFIKKDKNKKWWKKIILRMIGDS